MERSDLLENIKYLDSKFGTKILNKYNSLQNKKNLMNNFPSEINCILFFDKLFTLSNLTHDSERSQSSNSTPDWIMDLDGHKVMVEVYRQDINKTNFKNKSEAKLGQFITLEIKEDRINKGSVTKKYSKYIPLIKELDIPYYIFFEVDFLGDLDEIILRKFLYGPEHDDNTGEFPTAYTCFSEGFYYSNNKSKYINGFFILKDGKINYYHNYSSIIKPPKVITEKLLKFQYLND